MSLTHTAVINAKPKEKQYKLFDGGGLYLLVKPSGYKSWKYGYRLEGKQKLQKGNLFCKNWRDRILLVSIVRGVTCQSNTVCIMSGEK